MLLSSPSSKKWTSSAARAVSRSLTGASVPIQVDPGWERGDGDVVALGSHGASIVEIGGAPGEPTRSGRAGMLTFP